MNIRKSKLIIFCIFLIATIFGCQDSPSDSILGIDQPLIIDEIKITILEARIRLSYSSFYIMVYPPESHQFYSVIATINGLDEPRDALEWGKENLELALDTNKFELAHSKWILIGENIKYKYDEDFQYHYEFIFNIPLGTDPESCALHLKNGEKILLKSIVHVPRELENVSVQGNPNHSITTIDVSNNTVSGRFAVVNGGSHNYSNALYTTIGGGYLNRATAAYGTTGGGRENHATGLYTTIGGGYGNISSGRDSTIGGGSRNSAENYHTTIAGGIRNTATASDSTICGGAYNTVSEIYAFIGGGTRNVADGLGSIIGGGAGNTANSYMSTISGGLHNLIEGKYGVVGGGQSNIVRGVYSTVPGGYLNQANGNFGIASGYRAIIKPEHEGVFLFADSVESDFYSTTSNEFGVRATGGARIITSINVDGNPASGVILYPGSGSWSILSDKNSKENFTKVNKMQILEAVVNLPIPEWNYTSQNTDIRHIGPFAQDFYSAFNIGEDDRFINSIDADGIALISIQGLFQKFVEKEKEINLLETRIERIEGHFTILIMIIIIGGIITILIFSCFYFYLSGRVKNM